MSYLLEDWPLCDAGIDPETGHSVPCQGRQVGPHTACLAHLTPDQRGIYFTLLSPGRHVDHRGTTFDGELLRLLLDAVRDPESQRPKLGITWFIGATFNGDVSFESAVFAGATRFDAATFNGRATFTNVTFDDDVRFESTDFAAAAFFEHATFNGQARLERATFNGTALFEDARFNSTMTAEGATFNNYVTFEKAKFKGPTSFQSAEFNRLGNFKEANFISRSLFTAATFKAVSFESATFASEASFDSATFKTTSSFKSATFSRAAGFESAVFNETVTFESAHFDQTHHLGPLTCGENLVLSSARFESPVTVEAEAQGVLCRRTRWFSTASLRLRYAKVDFTDAVLESPVSVVAHPHSFSHSPGDFTGAEAPPVYVLSLEGVDAAHLVLTDLDLSKCRFAGTVHLDQLRLEGRTSFAQVPKGLHRHGWRLIRCTRRSTLAEEQHWRATQPGAASGWETAPAGTKLVKPAAVAALYRSLRKAFEDGKYEPGAADFYYGEMEMRRNDRTSTTRAERGLLLGYWLLSGYGLRASRALGWLVASMLVTIVLLMGFGLPQNSPEQQVTGTLPPDGGKVTLLIDKTAPQNPSGDRFTSERFAKAVNVTLNSGVFRSSGQDLTTAGTYIEMTSRIIEPVLLGLAVLAVRGRIKR
ncbi:pentapeptide repeat-containing protein [Streptomyces erythrochromogenes]|uniref:pentapeptide repeat-containing protein n=1 Tax=Streptomyces erythrochromogenes TaxID=285574 RepID=UPI0036826E2D